MGVRLRRDDAEVLAARVDQLLDGDDIAWEDSELKA